jgi:transcriptional regulator with XRE-family HTH domain
VYDSSSLAAKLPGLRRAREFAALSQDQLSERSGVSRSVISRIERGTPAFPSTVRRLADALEVPPSTLIQPPQDARCECGAKGSRDEIAEHVQRMKRLPHNRDSDYHREIGGGG